jgi:hypothetical protein
LECNPNIGMSQAQCADTKSASAYKRAVQTTSVSI